MSSRLLSVLADCVLSPSYSCRLSLGTAKATCRIADTLLSQPSHCCYQYAPVIYHNQVRGMRRFQEKTIRLMYFRGRSFEKIKYPIRHRNSRQDWNYNAEIFAFSKRIDESLSLNNLRKIFMTKEFVDNLRKEQERVDVSSASLQLESNADLIELGKPIYDAHIKSYLRATFSSLPEDGVAAIAEYLASEAVMADIGRWIGFKDIVNTLEYPPSDATLASTLFALVAGIEAECGLGKSRRFVIDFVLTYIHDKKIIDDIWHIPYPIESLNMILSNTKMPAYEPRIIHQVGAKTLDSCYIVGIYVDKKLIGSSPGETLEIAEECAALNALQRIFDLTDTREPMRFGKRAYDVVDYGLYCDPHPSMSQWTIDLGRNLLERNKSSQKFIKAKQASV